MNKEIKIRIPLTEVTYYDESTNKVETTTFTGRHTIGVCRTLLTELNPQYVYIKKTNTHEIKTVSTDTINTL